MISENTLQRVLWLADFLQIDDFEEKCIIDLVMTHIDSNNCLLFLNESFKKLKACDESNDIWYNLLNQCINFISKNLLEIYRNNRNFSMKINSKIMEEIIDRSLKHFRLLEENTISRKEIIEFLMATKNSKDVFDLLRIIKKNVSMKNINSNL